MKNQKTLAYHHQYIAPSEKEMKEEPALKKNKMNLMLQSCALNDDVSIENLHEHLRIAMMLELSTIPPYLCALYSIQQGDSTSPGYAEEFGDNAEVSGIIRSVMMEEMLHFTLAGNVLNAVGGEIKVNDKKYVPEYPTALPDSAGMFLVHLSKFDPDAIRVFLRIEQPTPPGTPPKLDDYLTIGQFYKAIVDLMEALEKEAQDKGGSIFNSDTSLQIDENYYYGGGGKIISVSNLEEAKEAIDVILEQGEGSDHSIYDTDEEEFGQINELAHYFKFNEIYEGQRYAKCQMNPKEPPQGEKMSIKYDKVYDMGMDLKTADLVSDELKALSHDFNLSYRELLDYLQDAFTGQQDSFIQAVGVMYKLKYKAIELMKNPIPGKKFNAGPTFEYVERDQPVA